MESIPVLKPFIKVSLSADYADPYARRQEDPDLEEVLRPDECLLESYVGRDAGSGLPFLESGKFQLDFLRNQGLGPEDVLLDFGCGSLRGGVHMIRYLNSGYYLGFDISLRIVQLGIIHVLGLEVARSRLPEFVVSDDYSFKLFSKRPAWIFSNSVYTHLNENGIIGSLAALATFAAPGTRFFATFNEGNGNANRHARPHYERSQKDRKRKGPDLIFTRDDMKRYGDCTGWDYEYLGSWGHPKNELPRRFKPQMMVLYTRRRA